MPSFTRGGDFVFLIYLAGYPVSFMRMGAGGTYMLAGRIAEAVPLLTQALDRTTAQDIMMYQAFCRLPLGAAPMLAGRMEGRSLPQAHAHQERGHQAYALRLLGDIAPR